MAKADYESGKAQTLETPAEMPTDHRPVIARARLPCIPAPARRRVCGGAAWHTAEDWAAEAKAQLAGEAQGGSAARLGSWSGVLIGRVGSGTQRAARNAAAREAEQILEWDEGDVVASASRILAAADAQLAAGARAGIQRARIWGLSVVAHKMRPACHARSSRSGRRRE